MKTGAGKILRAAAAVLCALVMLPLCASFLPGCTGDGGADETSAEQNTGTEGGEAVKNDTVISADKGLLGKFQVVFPEKGGGVAAACARKIIAAVNEKYGVRMGLSDDFFAERAKSLTVKPNEILVGDTNREETAEFLGSLEWGDRGFTVIGTKIVVAGTDDEGTEKAVDEFIDALKSAPEGLLYSGGQDMIFRSGGTFPHPDLAVSGRPLSGFRIVYRSGGDERNVMAARRLRAVIGEETGKCLPLCRADQAAEKPAEPSFLIDCAADMSYPAPSVEYDYAGSGFSVFERDGAPQVLISGVNIYSDIMAFEGTLKALENAAVPPGFVPVVTGETFLSEKKPVEAVPVKSLTVMGADISEYSIVYSAAEKNTAEAASELAEYIRKATGKTLPVITDDKSAAREIVIGKTSRDTAGVTSRRDALKNDGIMFYAEGGRLYIGSRSPLGQFYAVYRFLEEKIGCRFYSDNSERILPSDGIVIPADTDYSYSPQLFYRYTDWGLSVDMRRKLGLNGEDGIENRIYGFAHTLAGLANVSPSTQPCLSDENVYATVLKNVRQRIADNPGVRIISVTQNDNRNYCTCEKCSALASKEGQSGVMLTFVNRIAEDIEKDYPDVKILTFAYQYTRKPPATIKARDNVVVWLCSIECCFTHQIYDASCPNNVSFCSDLDAWADHEKNLYIWDYTTNYRYYNQLFPNLFTLRGNIPYFINNNAIGIYEEGDYQQVENGEFSRLRAYLLAHVLWDPDMTDEKYSDLMDDFLEGYYGAGWKYIRYYIDYTGLTSSTVHSRIYDPLPASLYDLEYCYGCFTRAAEAAEDAARRDHCRYSSIQIITLCRSLMPDDEFAALYKESGTVWKQEGNHPGP